MKKFSATSLALLVGAVLVLSLASCTTEAEPPASKSTPEPSPTVTTTPEPSPSPEPTPEPTTTPEPTAEPSPEPTPEPAPAPTNRGTSTGNRGTSQSSGGSTSSGGSGDTSRVDSNSMPVIRGGHSVDVSDQSGMTEEERRADIENGTPGQAGNHLLGGSTTTPEPTPAPETTISSGQQQEQQQEAVDNEQQLTPEQQANLDAFEEDIKQHGGGTSQSGVEWMEDLSKMTDEELRAAGIID